MPFQPKSPYPQPFNPYPSSIRNAARPFAELLSADDRQPSRVHFDEPSDSECPGNGMNPPNLPTVPAASAAQAPIYGRDDMRGRGRHPSGPPVWNIPNYSGNDTDNGAPRRPSTTSSSANNGQWPSAVPPHQTGDNILASTTIVDHRDSDATLYNPDDHNPDSSDKSDPKKYSVSSTSDNPYAPVLLPPTSNHGCYKSTTAPTSAPNLPALPSHTNPSRRSVDFGLQEADDDGMPAIVEETRVNGEHEQDKYTPEQRRVRRGVLAHLHDYHGTMLFPEDEYEADEDDKKKAREALGNRPLLSMMDSEDTLDSDVLPEDSPIGNLRSRVMEEKELAKINGRGNGNDPKDVEFNRVARLTYKLRRKEQKQPVIEHQITSMLNRHEFLRVLAKALLVFAAPSHRIETQLVFAAKTLNVPAEFSHLPSVIIISFVDDETHTSETHFIKHGGRLQLGRLHEVHKIYKEVLHDSIKAKEGTSRLNALLSQDAIYNHWERCLLAFFLSALICPLAFGGSFIDLWLAGIGAMILCWVQLGVASQNVVTANVVEIAVAILMSLIARGLSSTRARFFCYTAISSSSVIGILPGYLILTSSLELGSKNILCGSVKMVYALIYTLFLGFGLQIGSDLYLLFDSNAFHHLQQAANNVTGTVQMMGSFIADNATQTVVPLSSTFVFTNALPPKDNFIVLGCYRPLNDPWYLRAAPFWVQFLIVPIFSMLSSLANLQPISDWKSRRNMLVMVIISCASYATNKVANHYIFNHSDVVSAIGAFTIGILGNIWARASGGSAFTSMVTGVLFLVPSGLSQAGGITTNSNGIDVGTSMISVSIGITVGLFMSQALIHCFDHSKLGMAFSF